LKIWIISFTDAGGRLGECLADGLRSYGDEVRMWVKTSLASHKDNEDAVTSDIEYLSEPLPEWTKRAFSEAEAMVFIGATGIAVRAIAPFIKDKYQDPAVIVIDCAGHYCIPLLSGHIGGANRLSKKLAGIIGARPVITTATDEGGLFAVDSFAADNSLSCFPRELCKKVASRVIAGLPVGFVSEYPVKGTMPEPLTREGITELGICITKYTDRKPFERTLFLIPRTVWIGLGCRRGVSEENISRAVDLFLSEENLSRSAIAGFATCDIKRDEAGLLQYTRQAGMDLLFYSVKELNGQKGHFTASEFVSKTLGVDNVCERAAVAAAGKGGRILISKKIYKDVTVAAAESLTSIEFC
jgi:cobalt-precorrin 5A hydrolase